MYTSISRQPFNMKGISPIIATVLVVGFTIVMGAIVSIWGTSFILGQTQSIEEKFEEHVDCSSAVMKLERVTCNEDGSLLGMWHFEENGGSVARDSSPNGRQINLTNASWVSGKNGRGINFTARGGPGVMPEDTVVYFKFDDDSSVSASDSSGNGNTGTVYGPIWTTGSSCKSSFSSCMFFDGTDDYMDVPAIGIDDENDPVSLAAWVYSENGGSEMIITNNDGTSGENTGVFNELFMMQSPGNIYFGIGNAQAWHIYKLTDTLLEYNRWYFVSATYDGSKTEDGMKIYINGLEAGTTTSSAFGGDSIPVDYWHVGAQKSAADSPSSFFSGVMDEVLIVNRVLSPEEIYQLYLGGVSGHGALNGSESLTPSKFTIEGWVYKP
jgi:flagellin-like protein